MKNRVTNPAKIEIVIKEYDFLGVSSVCTYVVYEALSY